LYGGGSSTVEDTIGGSSISSKTTSYSVMKSEKTGAGIFNVGENTIPTKQLVRKTLTLTIPNGHLVLLCSIDDALEMPAHNPKQLKINLRQAMN